MNISAITLVSLWIASHAMVLMTLRDNVVRSVVFFISIVMLIVCYVVKPYTFDLEKYSIYFDTGYLTTGQWDTPEDRFQLDPNDATGNPYTAYGIGFDSLVKSARFFLPRGQLVPRLNTESGGFLNKDPVRSDAFLYIIMILPLFLQIYFLRRLVELDNQHGEKRKVPTLTIIFVLLGSLFFILGSQNIIRQYFGVTIILLAMLLVVKRGYLPALCLIVVAGTFHKWALVLGVVGGIAIYCSSDNKVSSNKSLFKGIYNVEIGALAAGIIIATTIKVSIFGLAALDWFWSEDVRNYVIGAAQADHGERTSVGIKIILLLVIVGVSEIICGKREVSKQLNIRRMRIIMLLFILPFGVYPEIFSRLLFFYFGVELIYLVWAFSSPETRTRLAGAMIFISYSVAPNALNVLVGLNLSLSP